MLPTAHAYCWCVQCQNNNNHVCVKYAWAGVAWCWTKHGLVLDKRRPVVCLQRSLPRVNRRGPWCRQIHVWRWRGCNPWHVPWGNNLTPYHITQSKQFLSWMTQSDRWAPLIGAPVCGTGSGDLVGCWGCGTHASWIHWLLSESGRVVSWCVEGGAGVLEGEDLQVVAVERKKNGRKNDQDGYHGNELHKLKNLHFFPH